MRTIVTEALIIALETVMVLAIVAVVSSGRRNTCEKPEDKT